MSLINDALKRAREAQGQAPPPPPSPLEFRPVELAQLRKQGPSFTLIVTVCIAVFLGGLLIWQWLGKSNATRSMAAKAAPLESPASAPPATVTTPTAPPISVSGKVPQPLPATEIKMAASAPLPVTEIPPSTVPAIQPAAPVSVPVIEPAKPAPPRLQAIVFRRSRPSAMISGKTLFVGDKFGELRVVAISEDSATLVGGGQTNVLILPQ